MKITSCCWIDYPDSSPINRLLAESDIYVEVSESEDGSIDHFDWRYRFHVCTVGLLEIALKSRPYYCNRLPLIVVERFDDRTIMASLEALLPDFDDFAWRE